MPMSSPPRPPSRREGGVALAILIAVLCSLAPREARADKVRDLAEVVGARDNQLVGFGIVTGLAGTGDDQSAPVAAQAAIAMLRRLGVQVDPAQVRLRNVAAVVVTATLPPFAKPGTKLDVSVSSLGNARSLAGGTLVQGLLKGADLKTYAVAQGGVVVGGFGAKGASGSSAKQGSLTSGRIPQGAIVEKEVVTSIVENGKLTLSLRTPGFTTAARVAKAVDEAIGAGSATAADGGSIVIKIPEAFKADHVGLIAKLEDLDVTPVRKSRVVISERTGTIVAGGDVRLAPAAIVHGGLTIVVKESRAVAQPVVGKATTVPKSDVSVNETSPGVRFVPQAPSLAEVAEALGTLGLSARELASVLSALRTAGSLEAEIVVE